MRSALADRSSGTTSTWLEALESRAFTDGSFFDDEFIGREFVVVLSSGDRAFQRLTNEVSRLLRSIGQGVESIGDGKSLDFTNNVASFFRRNPSVFGGRTN
jgi:hypothetical protein